MCSSVTPLHLQRPFSHKVLFASRVHRLGRGLRRGRIFSGIRTRLCSFQYFLGKPLCTVMSAGNRTLPASGPGLPFVLGTLRKDVPSGLCCPLPVLNPASLSLTLLVSPLPP